MDPASDWVVSGGKGALDFDGNNDFVSARQVYTRNAISMSAWVHVTGSGAQSFGYPVAIESASNLVAGIGSNVNNTAMRWVLLDGSGSTICDLSASINANEMTNFVGTWDGSEAVIYRNGIRVTSTTSTRVLATTASNIYIGRLNFAALHFFGRCDDVTVWDASLTGSEASRVYRNGRGYGIGPSAHRSRRALAAGTNRRRRIICGGSC